MPDLAPISYREKALNKRLNKTLDRGVSVVIALGVTVIGYGVIRETFDGGDTGHTRWSVVIPSLVGGLALIVSATYLGFKLQRRED